MLLAGINYPEMTLNYIIQISDTHLFGDKNKKINGSNSYLNLKKVLDYITNLSKKPELIVATGDLSQDCTFESYQHLANLLNASKIKYFLIPGNHDNVDVVNKVFEFNWVKNNVDYSLEFNGWFIYFIDTSIYPNDEGHLSFDQLINFKNNLNQNKNKSTIVFMHHHPIKINSPWMDKMILNEKEKFNEVIKQNPQVRGIFFGHIHQVFEKNINDVFYASAPSTSFQVLPNCEMFAVEKLAPGYRTIELDNNKLTSKVIWLE